MQEIIIDGRKIGEGHKPYIIAEVSANHNGNLKDAIRLIDLAYKSGADAVKLQTYTADTMTINCDLEEFKIKGGLWDGYNLYSLYEEAHTPWEWHETLFERARELGITIFSSPFDESAVDFLMELDVPAFKIASFEITDIPLIKYVAKQQKPIILSTGIANFDEIREAVEAVRTQHNQLIVLHCVSAYPTPPEESNLATIGKLKAEFDVVSGLSDHTLGIATSIASISLGAAVIEKHFIEHRSNGGPDSAFSIEPDELEELVKSTSIAWASIGCADLAQGDSEIANARFRRSIYVVEDVKEGEEITEQNIRRIRPGFGLHPRFYFDVLGKKAKRDLPRGTPLSMDHIEEIE